MRRIIHFLHAIGLLFLLASCINDDLEECPAFTVKVYVKDKNYSNIDNIPQLVKKNESTPFGGFIGTIYYQLRDVKTGDVIAESSDDNLEGGDSYYTITFNNIPAGDYDLIVWGNLALGRSTGVLHSEKNELTDLYVTNKRISFSPASLTGELMLERAKGDLVLICSNFPSEISRVEQQVDALYDTVDPFLKYMGNTTVVKSVSIKPVIETVLAPSVGGNSKLNLRFSSDAKVGVSKELVVPEIPLEISRNQITLVKMDYNEVAGTLEIWTFINEEWTMIHHLNILSLA